MAEWLMLVVGYWKDGLRGGLYTSYIGWSCMVESAVNSWVIGRLMLITSWLCSRW